jgi:hypothetical protein
MNQYGFPLIENYPANKTRNYCEGSDKRGDIVIQQSADALANRTVITGEHMRTSPSKRAGFPNGLGRITKSTLDMGVPKPNSGPHRSCYLGGATALCPAATKSPLPRPDSAWG